MDYKSFYAFYWLGTCFRYLQDASDDYPVHGDGRVIYNIEKFFWLLDEFGLKVTSNVAHSQLDGILASLKKKESKDSEKLYLTADEVTELRDRTKIIRATLDSEIGGLGAYSPTPKRLDLAKLVDNVGELFSPDVFTAINELSRFDFREAGKCIAFDRPTAAAFHLLRGTEGVLRQYYAAMVRKDRIKSLNWGPIVQDLGKRSATKGHTILNNHLDHLRDSFRNPTQHPEAVYDIHEVQDLWALCVEVVNRMVKTAKAAKRW